MKIRVKLIHYNAGLANGNIMFLDKHYPMKYGKFPKDHPFSDNPDMMTFDNNLKSNDLLGNFRALGYFASCFPEGDGITFKPLKGQLHDQVKKDIINTFTNLEIVEEYPNRM